MPAAEQARIVLDLIRRGRSDEDVERATGASRDAVASIRASAAPSAATAMLEGLQRLTGYQADKLKPRGRS